MHITIIGLGLIGGSIGLALKKNNWRQAQITGYVRRKETGQVAIKTGAIDRFELSLDKAVKGSEIVLISTPVLTIKDIFLQIAPYLPSGCIVTDTASTKFQVINWAKELLPSEVNFVGGHPMAGKEKFGIQAADADLFKNSVYCLINDSQATPLAIQVIEDMVENIGAKPLFISAIEHDNLVAGISHLPLLLSVALTLTTTKDSSWSQMAKLASTGYRDLTRLASGNPEVNSNICLSNRSAIIRWIDEFSKKLNLIRELVDHDNKEIQRVLTIANEARRDWLEKR